MTLADTLTMLVDNPSVTGTEGRLCTAIAERLLGVWGLEGVHRIGNSLVVGRRFDRPLISLYGHLDTVPEQGNLPSRIEDGRLFGLGASDMKAGLAVMIHLLEDPAVHEGPYDVVGVFYDKEEGRADENGLEAVLDRAEFLLQSELAIVLEPTDLELQLGCNGAINAEVTFLGKSAHAARPWLGENAVTKAGEWLAAMHRRERATVSVAGLDFHEVFTVTSAAGGLARNIIPPRFDLNVNYRFPPVYSLDEAEARLREVAAAADLVTVVDRAPAGPIPESNEHLARFETVSGAVRTPKQGWTDVARLAGRGIPAVNYGPGEVALAHQVAESVPLGHLTTAFRVLRDFLSHDE